MQTSNINTDKAFELQKFASFVKETAKRNNFTISEIERYEYSNVANVVYYVVNGVNFIVDMYNLTISTYEAKNQIYFNDTQEVLEYLIKKQTPQQEEPKQEVSETQKRDVLKEAMQMRDESRLQDDYNENETLEFIIAKYNKNFVAICNDGMIRTFTNKENYKIMPIEEFALDLGLLKLFGLPTGNLKYYLSIINEDPCVNLEVAEKWKDETITQIRCFLGAYLGKLLENETLLFIHSYNYFKDLGVSNKK